MKNNSSDKTTNRFKQRKENTRENSPSNVNNPYKNNKCDSMRRTMIGVEAKNIKNAHKNLFITKSISEIHSIKLTLKIENFEAQTI